MMMMMPFFTSMISRMRRYDNLAGFVVVTLMASFMASMLAEKNVASAFN